MKKRFIGKSLDSNASAFDLNEKDNFKFIVGSQDPRLDTKYHFINLLSVSNLHRKT